ncbi:MAG TPA: hypothetical protein VIM81_14595 [Gammaproteobacteria bacterium]|jgi:hypothetical protein
MLRLLKRWLGLEEDSEYFDPNDFRVEARPKSATARVLTTGPRKAQPKAKPKARVAPPALDFEEEPAEPPFDPYNTGKFDRSASWEKISKNNR